MISIQESSPDDISSYVSLSSKLEFFAIRAVFTKYAGDFAIVAFGDFDPSCGGLDPKSFDEFDLKTFINFDLKSFGDLDLERFTNFDLKSFGDLDLDS